jgi:WD40 repeat protein
LAITWIFVFNVFVLQFAIIRDGFYPSDRLATQIKNCTLHKVSRMASDYEGAALAVSCGQSLHLWRPLHGAQGEDKAVRCDRPVSAAAWNRNNKVVAAAREDGGIELRYVNGTLMSVLPSAQQHPSDPSHHKPSSRSITTLSWSVGSKKLAAGCTDGTILLHDLTSKTCKAYSIDPSATHLAAEFHLEDKFLAVAAADAVTMHDARTLTRLASLPRPQSSSVPFPSSSSPSSLADNGRTQTYTCLGLSSGRPLLAAGGTAGLVAVWDHKAQRLLHQHSTRHTNGVTATKFTPLEPSLLWTAGNDGMVFLSDLREDNAFHAPRSRVALTTPITAFDVREEGSLLAAGTADGIVVVYDPRSMKSPLQTLHCSGSNAVTSVHWQHNYQHLAARAREVAAQTAQVDGSVRTPGGARTVAATEPDTDARRNALINNALINNGMAKPHHPTASSVRDERHQIARNDAKKEQTSLAERRQQQSLLQGQRGRVVSIAATAPSAQRPSSAAKPDAGTDPLTRVRERYAALTRQRDDVATASAANSFESVSPSRERASERVMERDANKRSDHASPSHSGHPLGSLARPPPRRTPFAGVGAAATTEPSQRGMPAEDDDVHRVRGSHGEWSIKAATTSAHPSTLDNRHVVSTAPEARAVAETDHGGGAVGPLQSPSKKHPLAMQRDPRHLPCNDKPAAARDVPVNDGAAGPPSHSDGRTASTFASHEQTAAATMPSSQDIRNDILALHLDMLNQFQEHKQATAELVESLRAQQEDMSAEIIGLRAQLQDLLTRRDSTLWL